MEQESIALMELPSGILPAGVGYIIIPDRVDIDEFIEKCYRSNTVSIYAGYGHSFYHEVPIDGDVLQNVNFPIDSETYGSPIVWINIPKHNCPIVIASLKHKDDYYILETNSKRNTKAFNGNSIDVNMKANSASIDVNIIGNDETDAELSINIVNPNKSNRLKVKVQGDIILHATKNNVLISDETIQLSVVDDKGKIKGLLKYKLNEGLKYGDEFENTIIANEENIQIKAKKKVNVGAGKESMALGNTLKDFLDEFIKEVSQSTVTTSLGLMPLMNASQIAALQAKTEKILSKYGYTD